MSNLESMGFSIPEGSDTLSIDSPAAREGCEKRVTQFVDGTQILAAKIFHEKNSRGELVDREQLAQSELAAYLKFKETPLGVFIPDPVCLLSNESGQTIGLAVEWINGTDLCDTYPDRLLARETIDEFESALLESASQGIVPDEDMFSDGNLLVCRDTGRLFIAECVIDFRDRSKVCFPSLVKSGIGPIRDYYQKNLPGEQILIN
jgi:hypothetical protein